LRFTAPFSYYGGKSKLAHLFPAPKHDLVIEPFAGGASYAFRYWERQVVLNDLDPATAAIWRFLTSDTAADVVERLVPATVDAGMRVSEILPTTAHRGLFGLLQAEANQGTQGTGAGRDKITERGAVIWNRALKRKLLEEVIPRVGHWETSCVDYQELPNRRATWFIDPPYANVAGQRYRTCVVDFPVLAQWCRKRIGQTIVCENEGADWLPFRVLADRRGFHTSHQKSKAREVVWVNGKEA
jgi:hypothetical protein